MLQRLGLPPAVWADYLESVLLTVNGWASWCAYLGWEARLAGGSADGPPLDVLVPGAVAGYISQHHLYQTPT